MRGGENWVLRKKRPLEKCPWPAKRGLVGPEIVSEDKGSGRNLVRKPGVGVLGANAQLG